MTDIRIAVVDGLAMGYEPHPDSYRHTDVDGDRLLIGTAQIPDVGPGLYFRTDPNGSSVPVAELPDLIARLQVIADAARNEAAQVKP